MEIERFVIDVPQATLDDLDARLAATRWPGEIAGAGWDYGTDLAYLRELVEYWRTGFDWRAQERALNEFEHFRASVDGVGVHFIRARGRGPAPFPLIISHGWPGSVVEMLKIIPILTGPAAHGGGPGDSGVLIGLGRCAIAARLWVFRPRSHCSRHEQSTHRAAVA